jgi:ADP-ribose pyrophosphatase
MPDDQLAWETLSSETAYTCPGFDVVHEDVRLPDGTETDFDYLSEPPAVVILPFTPEGDVVLIEEWRQAVDRVNRGLPAGTTEPTDEDFATAARRELAEETGYEAEQVEPLETVEPANGVANAVHHHFVARDCTPTAEQDLDHDESIRVRTASFDDLYAEVLAGDVRDGRMVLALLAYAARERNA